MQGDGLPLRDHLNSLWRQTKEQPELLANAPELPAVGSQVWGYFVDLNSERQSNGMSVSRITSGQMRDWCWASGHKLELWERKAIRAIDSIWVNSQNESVKKK